MSRKTPVKEHLSDDNIDSSAPIRRSSRISSSNSINSPIPKSVSGSRTSEKNKIISGDAESSSPGREKKNTRRASTEEDIKPTPVKTRRTSVSKIIEEEKKSLSTPTTPTRRSTRAVSTSPTTILDVPARRTRRSISATQENEIVGEQMPVRRSTRRRSSVDTQEDVSKEETIEKPKTSARRRRSTSVDEKEENVKNDTKQKTRRLYSEDSQLEPIEEQETETKEKLKKKNDDTPIKNKNSHDLSVIAESEDTETEESKKIINDIDELLENRISPLQQKSVIEKIRSVFSPFTPKTSNSSKQTKKLDTAGSDSDINKQIEKAEVRKSTEMSQSPSIVKSEKKLIPSKSEVEEKPENRVQHDSADYSVEKKLVSTDKAATTTIASKEESLKEVQDINTEKVANASGKSRYITDKAYVSTGSDDSFTLHLNMSLDKTQFPEEQTDEDVFSSPGSNKENNSVNVTRQSLSKNKEKSADSKEITSNKVVAQSVVVDVFASKMASRNSFYEPMDVDCDLETSQIGTPKMSKDSKVVLPKKNVDKEMSEHNQASPKTSIQKIKSAEGSEENKLTSNITEKDTIENQKKADKSTCETNEVIDIEVNEKSATQTGKSENYAGYKKLDSPSSTTSSFDNEKSFIHVNSFESDKDRMDSSFDMLKNPNRLEKSRRLLNDSVKEAIESTTDKKLEESEDDMSSDISIRIVDTDEESENVKNDKSAVETTTDEIFFNSICKGSKGPRIPDGSGSRELPPPQKKEVESIQESETSMEEGSKTEESNEERMSKDTEKREPEPLKEKNILLHESPMKKSSSPHSSLKEEEQGAVEHFEEKDPKRKACVSLVNTSQKDEDSEEPKADDIKESKFEKKTTQRKSSLKEISEKHELTEEAPAGEERISESVKENVSHEASPRRKSTRLSLENKSPEKEECFGDEPKSEVKENELEEKNPQRKSSRLSLKKLQKDEDEEDSGDEKSQSANSKNNKSEPKISQKKSSRQSLKKESQEDEESNNDSADEQPSDDVKKNESEEKSPQRKSPRLSLRKKSQKDEGQDSHTIDTKLGVEENESLETSEKMEVNESDSSEDMQTSENVNNKSLKNEKEDSLLPETSGKDTKYRQSLNENFDDRKNQAKNRHGKEKTKSTEKHNESKTMDSVRKSNSRRSLNGKSEDEENESVPTGEQYQKHTTERLQNLSKMKSDNESDSTLMKNNKIDSGNKSNNRDSDALSKTNDSGENENSEDENSKSIELERGNKSNTIVTLENESIKSVKPEKQQTVKEIENKDIEISRNKSFEINKKQTEKFDENNCSKSDSSTSGRNSGTNHSQRRPSKGSENENPKKSNSAVKNAASPLKSKVEKMKACGVNFVNPVPSKSKFKLDDETSAKLDDFLSKKLDALRKEESDSKDEAKNEGGDSEDGSMSDDYEMKSGFLDDMAEEGEEDTPSEGSNDIIEEGESINSTESEIDSDETYDSDSFLVKDDGEDLELLSGEEYDLEVSEEFEREERKPRVILPKRKRIIRNDDLSSDEESAVPSPRVSFSEKVEVIQDVKRTSRTPAKRIKTPAKSPVEENSHDEDVSADDEIGLVNNDSKTTAEVPNEPKGHAQTNRSPRSTSNADIPSIQVDMVEDSSDEEDQTKDMEVNKTPNTTKEKSAFEERIRSLVEGPKNSTPNTSFNEPLNTSRHNTSARSSSIIVHENISISEIQDGFLAEKLQQVVNVFCAGIRTSDGNISMNVSLDYVENTPKSSASDTKRMDDVVICIEDDDNVAETEEKAPKKSRRSLSRSEEKTNESMNQQTSSKRRSSNVLLSEETKKDSPPSRHNIEAIMQTEDFSLLDASFNDENSIEDQNNTTNSGGSKKKRRTRNKKGRRLSNNESTEVNSSGFQPNFQEDKFAGHNSLEHFDNETSSELIEEIAVVEKSEKKKKSLIKMEKRSSHPNKNNEGTYVSPMMKNYQEKLANEQKTPRGIWEKEPSKNKWDELSENESFKKDTKNEPEKNRFKSVTTETISNAKSQQEDNYVVYEDGLEVVEPMIEKDEGIEEVKKKKKRANKKRKHKEAMTTETVPELTVNKRMKLLEMKCEDLSKDDLRHRLPSCREELGESKTTGIKTKKLKRLQSNLMSDIKRAFPKGLVTDVKNRPRRLMKPSVDMNDGAWKIEEDLAKPSATNVTKCSFNYKKIDSKDFKNQMLFDPRIKRENTSNLLRRRGYLV